MSTGSLLLTSGKTGTGIRDLGESILGAVAAGRTR